MVLNPVTDPNQPFQNNDLAAIFAALSVLTDNTISVAAEVEGNSGTIIDQLTAEIILSDLFPAPYSTDSAPNVRHFRAYLNLSDPNLTSFDIQPYYNFGGIIGWLPLQNNIQTINAGALLTTEINLQIPSFDLLNKWKFVISNVVTAGNFSVIGRVFITPTYTPNI